jgi:Immunoglobulin domain
MNAPLRALLHLIITTACLAASSRGQSFSTPPPEIVSAWKLNGENAILVFGYDGTYHQIQGDAADPGMERGTFQWDKTTQAFSVDTIVDTNGEGGLSHPAGATSVSIGGSGNNTLSYTVAGEGTFTFSRILNGILPSNAIVGSWIAPGEKVSITFLADGSYYHAEESNYEQADEEGDFYTGSEKGTYVWTSANGILTATPASDTNGDSGLSDPQPSFVVSVTGNTMTIVEGADTYTLTRITTNPTPLRLPDFTVTRFANHRQSSDATPVLRTIDDLSPYSADAIIKPEVNATAPTLKIGTATPFSIPADFDEPGAFDFEQEFSTLAALNSFLPASTALQFKSGTATANLTTAASQSFPSIPKIMIRGGGTWNGGEYIFGDDEVLQWTLPTGFVASQYLTIVEVYDPVADQDIAYAEFHGDATFLDLGGKLNPDDEYEVEIDFYRIDNSTTAGTGVFSGKQGYVLSASSTIFNVRSRDSFPVAPSIIAQPASQPGTPGSPLLLTVGINEEAFPFSTFQWFKNDVEMTGQTGNALYIPDFDTEEHSGLYKVIVTNDGSTTESNIAVVGDNDATIEFVVAVKDVRHVQTGPGTVILDPAPVTPLYGGPFGFGAGVEGPNMQALTAPTVTPPPGTPSTLQDPFYSTLFFNDDELAWRYGSDANDWGDLTQAAIDARFPNGTYTFLVDGISVPLNLTGNSYPNIPQMTMTGGSWINSKYAMDASDALTVTTNTFTGYSANADGRIGLGVNDSGVEFFRSSSPSTNFATYSVPANTLPPNEITIVDAEFGAIVDKSNAIPGAYCAALYARQLRIEVHILPEIVTQSSSRIMQPSESVNLAVTATGSPLPPGGSMSYQWSKNGVILSGETSPTLSAFSASTASAGTYTCTASNAVGSATTAPIILEYADAYQAYAASFSLNSVTSGAPEEDFDNDGIDNLLEFVLGGSPTSSNANLLKNATTTPAPGGRNLVFFYDRKTAANAITQIMETSPSLTGIWTPAVHGVAGVVISTSTLDGQTERVTATIPSTETKLFVRLKASR